MSNIAFVKIEKSDEYRLVNDLIKKDFETGKSYLMQIQGVATICLAPEKPTEGGFVLYNSPIFQYTPNGTDKLWVRTYNTVAYLNVSTQL